MLNHFIKQKVQKEWDIFKLLFNENVEIRYPKDNILRVSDGKWDTKKIMRVVE